MSHIQQGIMKGPKINVPEYAAKFNQAEAAARGLDGTSADEDPAKDSVTFTNSTYNSKDRAHIAWNENSTVVTLTRNHTRESADSNDGFVDFSRDDSVFERQMTKTDDSMLQVTEKRSVNHFSASNKFQWDAETPDPGDFALDDESVSARSFTLDLNSGLIVGQDKPEIADWF